MKESPSTKEVVKSKGKKRAHKDVSDERTRGEPASKAVTLDHRSKPTNSRPADNTVTTLTSTLASCPPAPSPKKPLKYGEVDIAIDSSKPLRWHRLHAGRDAVPDIFSPLIAHLGNSESQATGSFLVAIYAKQKTGFEAKNSDQRVSTFSVMRDESREWCIACDSGITSSDPELPLLYCRGRGSSSEAKGSAFGLRGSSTKNVKDDTDLEAHAPMLKLSVEEMEHRGAAVIKTSIGFMVFTISPLIIMPRYAKLFPGATVVSSK